MANYVYIENGYSEDMRVKVRLLKDGQQIMDSHPNEVHNFIRDNMNPGDTYQEQYAKRNSRVYTFGDMVLEWDLDDTFDNDLENYRELDAKSTARYHALRMVGR